MWGSLRDEIDPTIAAISTLLILLSALVIFGAEALRSGRGRAARPETSE
jgi:ABC-type spermidine/putrescine transport system permease subunit II